MLMLGNTITAPAAHDLITMVTEGLTSQTLKPFNGPLETAKDNHHVPPKTQSHQDPAKSHDQTQGGLPA